MRKKRKGGKHLETKKRKQYSFMKNHKEKKRKSTRYTRFDCVDGDAIWLQMKGRKGRHGDNLYGKKTCFLSSPFYLNFHFQFSDSCPS